MQAATSGQGGTAALGWLWCSLLLPPVAWVADLLGRYALSRWAFRHDVRWPFLLITALTLLSCALGAALGWRSWRRARAARDVVRATAAAWALAMAGYFFLLILAQAVPVFVLAVRELT